MDKKIKLFNFFRTFFLALSPCYLYYFLDSVLPLMKILYFTFFQQITFLIQKLKYLFRLVEFNLIFLFLVAHTSFNHAYAREDAAQNPPNVLIPIFDYKFIFKKHRTYDQGSTDLMI